MRKTLILFLFVCLTCSLHATQLHVEQIEASDFTVMVEKIGKLVINGTTLEFYDRQGELLYTSDMSSVKALTFDASVGIENVMVGDRYVVFPNPTSTSVTVKGLNESVTLRLYSLDGQFIKSVTGPTMNMENVANGTYLLQCENQIVKIIKQ